MTGRYVASCFSKPTLIYYLSTKNWPVRYTLPTPFINWAQLIFLSFSMNAMSHPFFLITQWKLYLSLSHPPDKYKLKRDRSIWMDPSNWHLGQQGDSTREAIMRKIWEFMTVRHMSVSNENVTQRVLGSGDKELGRGAKIMILRWYSVFLVSSFVGFLF